MDEFVLPLISAILGFLAKAGLDLVVKRRADSDLLKLNRRIAQLEAQLSELYWPLFLRLQRDNTVWARILERESADAERSRLAHAVEDEVLIPNHAAMVSIIETKMHHAAGDPELERALLAYLRHVSVYVALRKAGIKDRDPIHVGEPWPHELFPTLERRTRALQAEYDALLKTR